MIFVLFLQAGFTQEELIRRAFAGDDVAAEFAAAKAAEVEEELPQVRAGGWSAVGAWVGIDGDWLLPMRVVRFAHFLIAHFLVVQEEVPGVLPGWGTWAGQQREPQWVTDAKRKAAQ